MQNYIDLFLANWFISLPILIILVTVFWVLIRKGYLESLDLFGLKLGFHPGKEVPRPPGVYNLADNIRFTKVALDNISALGISEDKVLQLVDHEFRGHMNYFLWDLQDYPLPVQQNYIVVLDKINQTLTIRAVKSSNFNEAALASINNLLADYRRLGRYKYRTAKNYILRPETVHEISKSHWEVIRRLTKHYRSYKEPAYQGGTNIVPAYLSLEALMEKSQDPSEIAEYKSVLEEATPADKAFAFNLLSAGRALKDIDKLTTDLENGFVSDDIADREIVLALERSLQYIHKSINLLFAD